MTKYLITILTMLSHTVYSEDKSEWTPRTFNCPDLMFEFTLNYYSNPSDSELNNLCGCLQNKVSKEAQEINLNAKMGKAKFTEKDVNLLHSEFGGGLQACGAMKM